MTFYKFREISENVTKKHKIWSIIPSILEKIKKYTRILCILLITTPGTLKDTHFFRKKTGKRLRAEQEFLKFTKKQPSAKEYRDKKTRYFNKKTRNRLKTIKKTII